MYPHGSLVHLTPYQTETSNSFRYLFLSRSHLFHILFNELIFRCGKLFFFDNVQFVERTAGKIEYQFK